MRFSSRATEERPRSSSQTTVSVNFDESAAPATHPQLNFEVAECIETKTVTTTTTTKRCYPPLVVKEQRSLSSLNPRDFPLALKPTPPELAKFTFDVESSSGPLDWPNQIDDHDDVRIPSDKPMCLRVKFPCTLHAGPAKCQLTM